MAREDHVQAVGFAGLQVEELETLIVAAMKRTDEITAVAMNAVGAKPSTISGQAALQCLDLIKGALGNAVNRCEEAKAHLNEYGRFV